MEHLSGGSRPPGGRAAESDSVLRASDGFGISQSDRESFGSDPDAQQLTHTGLGAELRLGSSKADRVPDTRVQYTAETHTAALEDGDIGDDQAVSHARMPPVALNSAVDEAQMVTADDDGRQ